MKLLNWVWNNLLGVVIVIFGVCLSFDVDYVTRVLGCSTLWAGVLYIGISSVADKLVKVQERVAKLEADKNL